MKAFHTYGQTSLQEDAANLYSSNDVYPYRNTGVIISLLILAYFINNLLICISLITDVYRHFPYVYYLCVDWKVKVKTFHFLVLVFH